MVKVTGIDIGSSCIHLVELDGSARKFRLTKYLSFPRTELPAEEPNAGVPGPQVLIDDLKTALHDVGFTRERSLLAVSGSRCILRNIALPFRGRDEIRKVLKFEAEGYIHSHSIDDVVVDATVVEEHEDGTEMFLAACPKDGLEHDLRALHRVGMDPERADLSVALWVEAALHVGVFEPAAAPEEEGDASPLPEDLLIDVGANSIHMVLVRGGRLWAGRVLRWGLRRLEKEMADRFSVTAAEMCAALDEYFGGGPAPTADAPAADAAVDDGASMAPVVVQEGDLLEAAENLARRIARETTRFLSGFSFGPAPRRILLTGGGARLTGLSQSLAAASGMPVEDLALIERSGVKSDTTSPEFDLAFAAALAGLGTIKTTMNFRQEDLVFRPKFDRLKLPLAISLLTAMILLLFLGVTKYRQIDRVDRQIGLIRETKGKRVKTRGKQWPEYTGLLAGIAHPSPRRSFLQHYLRAPEFQPILNALPSKPARDRIDFVLRQLQGTRRQLEHDTGYFADLTLESGLAVLQAFSAAIDQAAKDPSVARLVIPEIHLKVLTTKKAPGFLKFKVAFGNEQFRTANENFLIIMRQQCRPDGPFHEVSHGAERIYRGRFSQGAEWEYEFKLNDRIPVFQSKKP